MNNNFFDRFKPKQNKFFPLLREMADVTATASALLVESISHPDYNHDIAVEYYKKIKAQEHKGDSIQHQIFEELNTTFITPFDREDINNLSSKMDDITDLVNSCSKRIMLYNPRAIPDSAIELAKLVNEAAQCLVNATGELDILKKSLTKIKEYCLELDEIEHKADDVYEHFLIDLFENEKDAIEVIKLKEILHELERATDAAETVGKIIKTIIVKYT